jgi:predicted enzyme related to lactoylglutathione lyase
MFKSRKSFSSFSVDDAAKAKDFYSRVPGLKISAVEGMQGLLNIILPGGGTLMIYEKADHQPATFTVLNFVVDDVEKTVEELTRIGVKFEIYDDPDYGTDDRGISHGEPKIAWFRDPAGNILSVLQDT